MKITLRTGIAVLVAIGLAACEPAGRDASAPAGPTTADSDERKSATELVAAINDGMHEQLSKLETADWVYANFITGDTAKIAAAAQVEYQEYLAEAIESTSGYDTAEMSASDARAIKLLRLATSQPAPNDAAKREALAAVATSLEGRYGSGRYCPDDGRECMALGELENILAESRDYDEQLDAWLGWRTVSPPMRDEYTEFVELTNEGARELGFADLGDLWKSGYDMSPAEFESEAKRLWGQVKPLYDELHCYVRARLGDEYGADKVPQDGPIPAHLLGNMWAQQWGEIYDLVAPYPDVQSPDVDRALKEQDWSAEKMVRTAEDFFASVGMPALPETFYERSLFTKPADRDVVCHASAWQIDGGRDPRIKMCIEPTYEMLSTIYHELGHIYYYIAQVHQPALFQQGAHDGFHEGIGDTVVLSLTPAFLDQLGLVDGVSDDERATVNTQMKMALDKIAFLPFGKLIDEWRWRVFAGDITPADYNAGWWKLREEYQGVAAPVERDETHFDPGAKYHIPGNTPYTRYFLAHILQFQFQRALCDAAAFDGPLHECSIYGNKEAGRRLTAMLAAGASEPWQDTLEKLTGTREMDASAIIDYFTPLMGWLREQNAGRTCGW